MNNPLPFAFLALILLWIVKRGLSGINFNGSATPRREFLLLTQSRFVDENLELFGEVLKARAVISEYGIQFHWLREQEGAGRVTLQQTREVLAAGLDDVNFVKALSKSHHLVVSETREVMLSSPQSTIEAVVGVVQLLKPFSNLHVHFLAGVPARNSSLDEMDAVIFQIADTERSIHQRLHPGGEADLTPAFRFVPTWQAFRRCASENNSTNLHMPDPYEINPFGAFLVAALLVGRIENVDLPALAENMTLLDAMQREEGIWLSKIARDVLWETTPPQSTTVQKQRYSTLDVRVMPLPGVDESQRKSTEL